MVLRIVRVDGARMFVAIMSKDDGVLTGGEGGLGACTFQVTQLGHFTIGDMFGGDALHRDNAASATAYVASTSTILLSLSQAAFHKVLAPSNFQTQHFRTSRIRWQWTDTAVLDAGSRPTRQCVLCCESKRSPPRTREFEPWSKTPLL